MPLVGFSLGVTGIAWVLLKLTARTGDGRLQSAALEAIAYGRALFQPQVGNWPDLLNNLLGRGDDQPVFETTWCQGAPGVALARLVSLPFLDDATTRQEIQTALGTTVRHGLAGSHCLCHDALGHLDPVLHASRVLADAHWTQEATQGASGNPTILPEAHKRHELGYLIAPRDPSDDDNDAPAGNAGKWEAVVRERLGAAKKGG